MSVIPAIKSGSDEKHSAAGAEGVTVHMCVNCIVNNTAIRTVSYCSAVMDDLILCSYRLQLILPLQPEHFCLIMLFCELLWNCCRRFQISWLPFSEKQCALLPPSLI